MMAMSPFPTSKGYLNPGGGVQMTRLPPGEDIAVFVRHYWIPRWDLPTGAVKRQVVLGYPACNLVVEPDQVTLAGPTTRVSHRTLAGSGWAVGALLRPAAGPALLSTGVAGDRPAVAALVDREVAVDLGQLRAAVTAAMSRGDVADASRELEGFLRGLLTAVGDEAMLANRMQEIVESEPVRTVDGVARALAVSPRTLHRLARSYTGLSPGAMIRRRRLQDAADVVRRTQGADLATVAAESSG
jgi:AraC-like DNA-binding protein